MSIFKKLSKSMEKMQDAENDVKLCESISLATTAFLIRLDAIAAENNMPEKEIHIIAAMCIKEFVKNVHGHDL